MADIRYKVKGNNFSAQIENGQKFKSLISKVYENQKGEDKFPLNFINEIAHTSKVVKHEGSYYLKDYTYKGTITKFDFLDDNNFLEALKLLDRPTIKKFEEGGEADSEREDEEREEERDEANERLEELMEEYDLPREVIEEYQSVMGREILDIDELPFSGRYDSEEDFAEDLVEQGAISNLSYYLEMTSLDMRLLAQEEADARVDDMSDDEILDAMDMEDEANEYNELKDEIDNLESDVDDLKSQLDDYLDDEEDLTEGEMEMREERGKDFRDEIDEKENELENLQHKLASLDTYDEVVDKAREQLRDVYYDDIHDELERDAVGYFVDNLGYAEEDLANNNLFRVDYEKLASDLSHDYTIIEHGGDVYVFASYMGGGMTYAKGGGLYNEISKLYKGYLEAVIFTEEENLGSYYTIHDFDAKTKKSTEEMLTRFYNENESAILKSGLDLETIGNDIWYTRSGQGAGFFDHNLDDDVERKLINGAKKLGEYPSVEENKGKISISKGRVFAKGGMTYVDGGEVDKNGLIYALQNDVSAGTIAGQTYANTYDEVAEVRHNALEILYRDGDKPYSLDNLIQLLKKAEKVDNRSFASVGRRQYADGGSIYAKGGNLPSIEKRVAEVNAMIKEGNEKGLKVIDESQTLQSPMKYKPLKYSNGVLYGEYEELDLYKSNRGQGNAMETKKFKITKRDEDYGYSDNMDGYAQRLELTDIARMYRKALNHFNKYGWYGDGGVMAKGGVTFDDKVKSIKKRLEGMSVAPKYRKEYGKTYDKSEALSAAKAIAGSMRAKEMSKKKS